MIWAEATIFNLETNKRLTSYSKTFDTHISMNDWYKSTKKDKDFVVSIMWYNPKEKPSLKLVYDVQLLRVQRGMPV